MDTFVLGISFDTPEENKAFAEKFSFPFDLLSDEGRKIGLEYGAARTDDQEYAARVSFLIDPEGKVKQVYDPVDVNTHASDVLSALR